MIVLDEQLRDSAIQMHGSILHQTLLPSRLSLSFLWVDGHPRKEAELEPSCWYLLSGVPASDTGIAVRGFEIFLWYKEHEEGVKKGQPRFKISGQCNRKGWRREFTKPSELRHVSHKTACTCVLTLRRIISQESSRAIRTTQDKMPSGAA